MCVSSLRHSPHALILWLGRSRSHLHAKFDLESSNRLTTVHQRHRQDRTDRTDRQRTDSIRRTVLQTVAQKRNENFSYLLIYTPVFKNSRYRSDLSTNFRTQWLKRRRMMQGCVPFWSVVDAAPHLRGQSPQNSHFGGTNTWGSHFQAKPAKITRAQQ